MIFEKTAQKRCSEPLNHVENYDKAITDKTSFWYLTSRDKSISGIRPAKDFIFVRKPNANKVELAKVLSKQFTQNSIELF